MASGNRTAWGLLIVGGSIAFFLAFILAIQTVRRTLSERKQAQLQAYQARYDQLRTKQLEWKVQQTDMLIHDTIVPADKLKPALTAQERAEVEELLRRIAELRADGVAEGASQTPNPQPP